MTVDLGQPATPDTRSHSIILIRLDERWTGIAANFDPRDARWRLKVRTAGR
jgi:hypothetical protein